MENLHKIARGYYDAATETIKKEAQSLFKKMDTNGDGKVSLVEFMNGLNGDDILIKKYFDVVDVDRSGDLDFWEVITFYYLNTVGRRWCDNCGAFVIDMYYTCVTCFSNTNSFDLCLSCYHKTNWNHQHRNFSRIDNLPSSQPIPAGRSQSEQRTGLEIAGSAIGVVGTTLRAANAAVKLHHTLAQSSSSLQPDDEDDDDDADDTLTDLAEVGLALAEAACSLM